MDGFKIGSSVDTCTALDLAIVAESMEEWVLTDPPPALVAGAIAAAAAAGRFLASPLAADRELDAEDHASLDVCGGAKTLLATTATCCSCSCAWGTLCIAFSSAGGKRM